jgi:molybdopterin molybdotransferase
MISVEEAFRTIQAHLRPLPAERVPLIEAAGRVLSEPIVAPANIPPFDNSAMDGYAVRAADLTAATELDPVPLKVVGAIAAGAAGGPAVAPGTAVRIMTGAPLPEGADAVIMREETREFEDRIEALAPVAIDEHIRRAGEDVKKGAVVFAGGHALNPAALGVLASLGFSEVTVRRRPTVAILGTGDELVPLGQPLGAGQIHDSSAIALEALVRGMGALPIPLGIARDDAADLRAKILEGAHHDVLLTTGGVSVGDHDLVKTVLGELGELDVWRINMQPGKPLAFGRIGGTLVFGLPGNPVSSLVAFEVFVRPALRALQGHQRLHRPQFKATLLQPITKQQVRRQYLRAVVDSEGGSFNVMLTGPQGSHQLTSVARANALLVLGEGERRYLPGDRLPFWFLDEDMGAGL